MSGTWRFRRSKCYWRKRRARRRSWTRGLRFVSPETLPDLQQRFRATVLGNDDAPLSGLVQTSGGSLPARIDVYRNTVQSSLVDVLATAFPVVQRVVGEVYFAGLARRFIVGAPPRLPQLSTYGADFAAYIGAGDIHKQLPYLADVARLEWARGAAYFAADAPLLDPATLGLLAPEDMERKVFSLHPAARLIRSSFPIYRIWQVNQPDVTDVPAVDMSVGEDALISRPRYHVVTRAIARADAAFVAAIAAGGTLASAAAQALEIDETFDLQAALTQHFVNGTFAR
ncbi:MAG: DUF2063 domain-containing protein [Rhodospirillaceae bacterium]|nr:DUF2063 domain-containing protein [Rhodospirillaceae bacterium]